jgi:hypothetical protein
MRKDCRSCRYLEREAGFCNLLKQKLPVHRIWHGTDCYWDIVPSENCNITETEMKKGVNAHERTD